MTSGITAPPSTSAAFVPIRLWGGSHPTRNGHKGRGVSDGAWIDAADGCFAPRGWWCWSRWRWRRRCWPGTPAAASTRAAQTTHDFWLATSTGDLYTFGVIDYGDPGGAPLNRPIVAMVPTHDRHGYWMVASDGGIFSYGDTRFFGSTGNIT